MSARAYIRPGFLIKLANPIVRGLGLVPTLTVRGRRSGEPRSVPFGGPFELEGVRYLVSGRGETDWARNLRVAGVGELRTSRLREAIRAVELFGAERERVLAAYRHRMGRSVEAYFRRLPAAADHPVFRIESLAS